jgi:hypothetical protein
VSTKHGNVISAASIDATAILDTYNNKSSKRPVVNTISMPIAYDGNTYATGSILNFSFQATSLNNSQNTMTANLYLDVNGDGLYNEATEKFTTLALNTSGSNYSLSYRIPDDYAGVMPWKLEITDNNAGTATSRPKSTIIGATAFNDSSNPLVVRVLQLYPTDRNGNTTSTFDLSKNLNNTPLKLPGVYDMQVTEMSLKNFAQNYHKTTRATKTSYDANGKLIYNSVTDAPTTLNGNYDMVLVGFADCYSSDDMNANAINEIKSFIGTNQSVMFTHDTIAEQFCPTTTIGFRDIVGQSRYADSNNIGSKNPDNSVILHDASPNGKSSVGYTYPRQAGVHNYDSTLVHKVNDGIITQFPYPLNDIPISSTHPVYYQLDFADPSVIPWYTIDNGTDNKYNSRDYYYTYSKGNITYSGSGDHPPTTSESESKLFVNTMIKASRSSNHAPVIQVTGIEDNQNVATSLDNLQFSFVVTDIDNDAITSEVYINNTKISNYSSISGESKPVNITKAQLAQLVGSDDTFTITVKAKDSKNADATPRVFNLNYIKNDPVVNLASTLDKTGCLVGDSFNLTATATVSASDPLLNTVIKDASFNMGGHAGVTLNSDSTPWKLTPFTIKGTVVNPNEQSKTYNFTATSKGTYMINDSISYSYNGAKTQPSNCSIDVDSGAINFSVVDKDGNNLTKDVNLKVTKSGGSTQSLKVSNGTGFLQNLVSGNYTIAADIPDGYSIKSATMKPHDYATNSDGAAVPYDLSTSTLNLSYNNGSPTITITLDAAAPIVTVTHTPANNADGTTNTDHPVTVTVDFGDKPVTDKWYSENGGPHIVYTSPFLESDNVTITAGAKSAAGVEGHNSDQITNINRGTPTGNVTYDIQTPTKGNVIATISNFTKNGVAATGIIVTNNNGLLMHTFTENGSFVFNIIDALGITGTVTATVGNIDKTDPSLTFTQNPSNDIWSKDKVTITATASDAGSGVKRIQKPDGTWVSGTTANFDATENTQYTFTVEDNAGNTHTEEYTVSNLDRVAPKGTIAASRNSNGGIDLVLSVTDNASKPENIKLRGSNTLANHAEHTLSIGETDYTFYFVDEAGNLGSVSYSTNDLKER